MSISMDYLIANINTGEDRMIKLETERLIVRDFRLEDAESLARNINHPTIFKLTAHIPQPYTLETAVKYMQDDSIERDKDPRVNYRFAIQLKDNPEVIGSIGLHKIDWKNGKAEIGYWLAVDHHKKGIMSEVEKVVLDFGFDKLKLYKIVGACLSINQGSTRLFLKFGFRHVGTFIEDRVKDGKRLDAFVWELLARDYKNSYD